MSEYVVRMEMPQSCEDCAAQYDCMACGITGSQWYGNAEFDPSKGRLSDCPIICQLPDGHGRLVDKNEMLKKIENYHRYMTIGRESDPRCIIEDSPTIVPAVPAERSET